MKPEILKHEVYYASKNDYDINLRYCGYETCAPNFRMNPHVRSEYLIHYVTSGKGLFTCENQTFPLNQHDIFMIRPSQISSYETDPEFPLSFSWFAFAGEKVEQHISLLGFSRSCPIKKLPPRYSIDEYIHLLVEHLNTPGYQNEFEIQSIIYSIMSNMEQAYSRSSNYRKNNQTITFVHVKRAKSYIKCNYIYPITVTDVAKHVGLERSYLSKIFHQCTGKTLQNYLLDVRIHRSKFLLERTNYTIKEISYSVGITDEYYFSRIFRQVVGVPPSQYRIQSKTHLSPL